jgi:signal transduction histidine kinase
VPPNLDTRPSSLPPTPNSLILELLDRFSGPACLLDPEGNIAAVGASWDDFASRHARPDLNREQATGRQFGNLMPESEQRSAFQEGLSALAEGGRRSFTLTADLGSDGKLLVLHLHVQAIRQDERLSGYLLQGTDVTGEQLNRQALLDRDRKLRKLRTDFQHQTQVIAALRNQLESIVESRNRATDTLLNAFERERENFPSALCRLSAGAGDALFTALWAHVPETRRLRFAAQHNAPDYPRLLTPAGLGELEWGQGPAGIAAQTGSPAVFRQLLVREDFAAWKPLLRELGANCVWVFPVENGSGLYGELHLYFGNEAAEMPPELAAVLTAFCRSAAPLLRVQEAWKRAATQDKGDKPAGFRTLAAGLADEFSNLLTGVLGHSSLIAAEMGEGHAALKDVRAIEKAARGAAKLTRRLTALCGHARHDPSRFDVTSFLRSYVTRDRCDFFPAGPASLELPEGPLLIATDGPTLEVILDGMAQHACTVGGGVVPEWSLQATDETARITLTYDGAPSLPPEWATETWSEHPLRIVSDLLLAREAAGVAGGELSVTEQDGRTLLVLSLPLAPEPAPHEQS